jgi:hypothetical protein
MKRVRRFGAIVALGALVVTGLLEACTVEAKDGFLVRGAVPANRHLWQFSS